MRSQKILKPTGSPAFEAPVLLNTETIATVWTDLNENAPNHEEESV